MSKETSITFEIDMNQDNGKRALRTIERHLVENSFTIQSSSVDEDWASVSYKTNRSLSDIRSIQNHLFNHLQAANIRISSDILQHTPMITFSSEEFSKNSELISSLGVVNKNNDVIEVSFDTSFTRDAALESLKSEGINGENYFNEVTLESKNNFISKKNSLNR